MKKKPYDFVKHHRLITGECDKTIKFYKEDEEATEETHPIDLNWRPDADKQRY